MSSCMQGIVLQISSPALAKGGSGRMISLLNWCPPVSSMDAVISSSSTFLQCGLESSTESREFMASFGELLRGEHNYKHGVVCSDIPAGRTMQTRSSGVTRRRDCGADWHNEQVADWSERWGQLLTRRSLLALPLAAAILPVSPSWASVTVEDRAPYGNAMLRSFGIGDPDIYYPRFFEGTWNCYSTLVAIETPQGEDKVDLTNVELARRRLGYTTTYQARFVAFEGYVVCDRLFTTVSLVESIIGKNTIEQGTWNPQQPNRLALLLTSGTKVENTVTKRSAGMFSPHEFESAEFSKQVLDNSTIQDGPPTVKASKNLTRYQWDNTVDAVTKIEAIQKVSMYAVPKEGQEFEGMEMFNPTLPITIYKYRITFERQGS